MVPIEPQRTHIQFDGLCDMFGALSTELVAREVEGRQRPVILNLVSDQHRTSRCQIFLAQI